MLSGFCPACFGVPFCSVTLGCRYTHHKLLNSHAHFPTGGVFEWDIAHRRSVQYCICCIRSGLTRCSLIKVLYLDCMCQCGLHDVLWSHICILMWRLAAEPRSTEGLLFPSLCPSGTILLTLYSMVWDWRVSRALPMLFYWPKLLYPYYSLQLFFPFLIFLFISWYCEAV